MSTSEMERPIHSIQWQRAGAESPIDITDQLDEAVVSATPHPDENVNRPKGYTVKLTLKPESASLAQELQEALMDVENGRLTVRLADTDEPATVPARISKVPYLDDDAADIPREQRVAELPIPSEGHDQLHDHFSA